MKKTAKKKGMSAGKVITIGVGIAALTAATYLLVGPNGKKNRKTVKAWMMKMKAEVAEKLEGIKEVTLPIYEKIVHEVADKYKKVKNIDPKELQDELTALKKEWNNIVKNTGKKTAKKKKVTAK